MLRVLGGCFHDFLMQFCLLFGHIRRKPVIAIAHMLCRIRYQKGFARLRGEFMNSIGGVTLAPPVASFSRNFLRFSMTRFISKGCLPQNQRQFGRPKLWQVPVVRMGELYVVVPFPWEVFPSCVEDDRVRKNSLERGTMMRLLVGVRE